MRSTAGISVILAAAAVALAVSGPTITAQGRGSGRAGAPAGPPPVQGHGGKPATPPAHPAPQPNPGASENAKPPKPQTQTPPVIVRPELATTLTPLLPAGTDVSAAAAGFKNLGQFVAAVHVSHNLDIPFDALKTRLTGPQPVSLGQAIGELKPGVHVDDEVRRAETAARDDMRRR
jgi:hypothetical protein